MVYFKKKLKLIKKIFLITKKLEVAVVYFLPLSSSQFKTFLFVKYFFKYFKRNHRVASAIMTKVTLWDTTFSTLE